MHVSHLLALASSLFASTVAHAQSDRWIVTTLNPQGAAGSFGRGTGGGQQAGTFHTGDSQVRAALWSGGAHTLVDLHPAGTDDSELYDADGDQQVGVVYPAPNEWNRAALWTGSAASWVDLHPAGLKGSKALGVDGGQQVGYVHFEMQPPRAALWTGTVASWVDLNPQEAAASTAYGVRAGTQVGSADIGHVLHAGTWTGTAASWVDLHPAGAIQSEAMGIDAGQQVGYAQFVEAGPPHAGLWTGTRESWVELHPAGCVASFAAATSGGLQVGSAVFDSIARAGVWSGTAESWEALPLPSAGQWQQTYANDVWSDATTTYVVGIGYTTSAPSHPEALLWTRPVACPADLSVNGAPDGAVTIDDLLSFLASFESGSTRVDLDDGTATSTRDGAVTIEDLIFFLVRFEAGC